MKNNAPIIQCDGIGLFRDDHLILQDFSWQIESGSIGCIIGPSGSGKTSLFFMLCGLLRAQQGSLLVAGDNFRNLSSEQLTEKRRDTINLLFQHYNLVMDYTALDNVILTSILGFSAINVSRAQAYLKQVGLLEKQHDKAACLSGGEQQRLALARILYQQPSLVLADEPTGNLDHESALLVLNALKYVNQQGVTVLIATHDDFLQQQFPCLLSLPQEESQGE